jgi:voltage-gated potassium channel
LGQTIASFIMILGYAIIAVPGGIIGAELTLSKSSQISTEACPQCSAEGHDKDAEHCKFCGAKL